MFNMSAIGLWSKLQTGMHDTIMLCKIASNNRELPGY
uniref:Uncharacterized protein n=1 Tax=Arundo donax TaxID=35708 RepID=A0A0A8YPP0_ARUDO